MNPLFSTKIARVKLWGQKTHSVLHTGILKMRHVNIAQSIVRKLKIQGCEIWSLILHIHKNQLFNSYLLLVYKNI